jgi:hypothetical protein
MVSAIVQMLGLRAMRDKLQAQILQSHVKVRAEMLRISFDYMASYEVSIATLLT